MHLVSLRRLTEPVVVRHPSRWYRWPVIVTTISSGTPSGIGGGGGGAGAGSGSLGGAGAGSGALGGAGSAAAGPSAAAAGMLA